MTGFFSRLEAHARQVDSLLCIGLDPHPADLAAPTADAARTFCRRLIDATADLAAAYKPNAAFFEALGPAGWAALKEVIAAIPSDVPVILDAKRGDIASTARAYARAAFETLGANAITLSPYMGHDSLTPFLADPTRGVFLLCKTSNPGASDLQDLLLADPHHPETLYERVARLARAWNRQDNVGLVVGATQPEALGRVRQIAPELWILAPGVGTQGGNLERALVAGLRADGLGLLIPVSRAVAHAADPRQAAREIRDAIRRAQAAPISHSPQPAGQLPASLEALAEDLLTVGCVRFGEFTLKSGLQSPIYIDLRRLASYPDLLARVACAYGAILDGLHFDRLAALPYAALPIATAISLESHRPMIYPRRDSKDYGTRVAIEGVFAPGERAVVIDDLATTGDSKFEAIDKLRAAGLHVQDVVVLIDRESGAKETLAAAGYRFHAVLSLTQLLDHWEQTGRIPQPQIATVRAFLAR